MITIAKFLLSTASLFKKLAFTLIFGFVMYGAIFYMTTDQNLPESTYTPLGVILVALFIYIALAEIIGKGLLEKNNGNR
jgi:glycerol uptake facilitator-like aquaporin